MKIAIISDLHDNEVYVQAFASYCQENKIETILCCGDVTNDETLILLNELNIPLYLIKGNADIFNDKIFSSLKNITYLGRTGEIMLSDKKIGLCHEPFFIKTLLEKNYYIIFYGHTHKPWVENKHKTHIINPGTLGGINSPSTFAIWEIHKPLPELIITSLSHKIT